MPEKVRIEVHPSLEEELKKIKMRIQQKINTKHDVNVLVGQNDASRIAAMIIRKSPKDKIIVQNLFKKRGRARINVI